MSHSWQYGEFVFIGNSDLSGVITIRRVTRDDDIGDIIRDEIEIPGEHLLEFVADFVRTEKISHLEQASTNEVLGIHK